MWGTVAFAFPLTERGPVATLSRSVVWGTDRLRVDGKEIPRSPAADRPFVVSLADGATATVVVRGRGFDYAPRVFVDGREIEVARRLAPWEYGVAGVPILLVVPAGLVGLVVGFGAMAVNQWILRGSGGRAVLVARTFGVDVASCGLTLLLVTVFGAIVASSAR